MEKQILFNTEMVRAILEGRKTCTRRIIKDVNGLGFIGIGIEPKEINNTAAFGHGNFEDIVNAKIEKYVKAPCLPEDILYVRETWKKFKKRVGSGEGCYVKGFYGYKADEDNPNNPSEFYDGKWRPSIHMPKEAARIYLKVIDVRVERLQDITEEQIKREGIKEEFPPIAQDAFQALWDSTTKEYRWALNPWVWVIEFERIEK